jgi:5-methylthioadenosine/S-adenosylhomocysteine deaminase
MTDDMTQEICAQRHPILITGVRKEGGIVDIFLDGSGTITAIGEGIRKQHRDDAEFVVDGDGAIAIPGLVNTHTHAAMSMLRGYADDMILQDWLCQKIWPLEAHLTGNDVYQGTRLACLEMIRTGTVAFNDMYFFMEDAARAAEESGMRAMLSYGFIDLCSEEKREQECRATERLAGHIRAMNNPRIRTAVGPHAVYTVSREGLSWCAEYAKANDLGINIHLSETEKEVKDCIATQGKRPSVLLDECGMLTDRTVAAHCCWLDEDECQLLGRRGVHVSQNSTSNMKLATNRAMPWHHLKAAGVNISLGTDGCASNNNLDLFEEAKIASLLQKFYWNDPCLLPAPAALEMATSAGARSLRLGTGRLAVGEPADIVLISAHAACNTPLHNPVSNMIYSCSGSTVETTICDGRVLMLNREIPGEEDIIAAAAGAACDLVRRANSG